MHLVSIWHQIEHGETLPRGEVARNQAMGNSVVASRAIGYSFSPFNLLKGKNVSHIEEALYLPYCSGWFQNLALCGTVNGFHALEISDEGAGRYVIWHESQELNYFHADNWQNAISYRHINLKILQAISHSQAWISHQICGKWLQAFFTSHPLRFSFHGQNINVMSTSKGESRFSHGNRTSS